MKPSNILRGLYFLDRAPIRAAKVVPLPQEHSSNDLKNTLRETRKVRVHVTASDLLDNVSELVAAQEKILASVSDPNHSVKYDRSSIDEYLEDGVDLLDVCKFLLGKIELVKRYGDSVKRAVYSIYPGMDPARFTRVKESLEKKRYCEDDVGMEKCWSRLRKLVVKEKRRRQGQGNCDGLTGSLADAVESCRRLDTALSFKRRWRSGGGGCTGQMMELRGVIFFAKKLRDLTAEKAGKVDGEYIRKKCDELVHGLRPLEERVKELYSKLVSIGMAVLGIMSQQS